MSTMTICMSDEDAALACRLANSGGVIISDFTHTAILEKVENSYDLHELRAAVAADDGQRLSIDEIFEEP